MAESDSILKGKKVLLVEDDIFLSNIIESKLVKAGLEFSHAKDGDEALSMLENMVPDVILLDILFPGGTDGFGVLEKIKADNKIKKVPVIILSNLGQLTDIEKGMSRGAFRYIVKASLSPEEILKHIESALESSIK